MDLGSKLSTLFGDYKGIDITVPKKTRGSILNTEHYRSSTTNSYNKCIRELSSKFPEDDIIERALIATEKHDQNSFDESVELGLIIKWDENTCNKRISGKQILRIIGKYKFKWFAHCKSVEMWIELHKDIQ